ncbi:MAG: sigma-70 family RNA polymerase sigma factor [Mangrovibacterium sp.]|nr:sigma-70 family RNA polymerase sigma factor [Mangrovibacterium sp.]
MEVPDNNSGSVDWLWQKFQQGEYGLLETVFKTVYRELYTYGLKLLPVPETVCDTIQEIFADIWSRREKMYTVEKIRPYLFISVRHELLKQIEKRRRNSQLKQDAKGSFEFSKEDFIIREETEAEISLFLVKCLQRLTARQREVILLRFHHELKFDDIASVMNMNVQSVRNLLVRALDNLRHDRRFTDRTGSGNIELFLLNLFLRRVTFL